MLSIFPSLLPYGFAFAPLILRLAVALACLRISHRQTKPIKITLLLAGLCVLAGFLLQPIALALIVLYLYLYRQEPHMDYLLLAAILLALLFLGPGILAIDLPL